MPTHEPQSYTTEHLGHIAILCYDGLPYAVVEKPEATSEDFMEAMAWLSLNYPECSVRASADNSLEWMVEFP